MSSGSVRRDARSDALVRAGSLGRDAPPGRTTDLVVRAVDVTGAAIVLGALAPVLGIAALAVRLSSPGPIWCVEERYGRGETRFPCVKLRTMVVPEAQVVDLVRAEALERRGVRHPAALDSRLTPVGRLLCRTSIDELPQLWNVLRGDMSLVGPRPLPSAALDPYPELRAARCRVKPGLTGRWRIGRRAGRSSVPAMVDDDLEYVRTRNLRVDLGIVARTLPAILRGARVS